MEPAAARSSSPGLRGSSLAQWKAGASKMTTAAAGDHVAKTAPRGEASGGGSGAPRKPKPRPSGGREVKAWADKTFEEKFGTGPPKAGVIMTKQVLDTLKYLEAAQDRGCISWEEIVEKAIPSWYDTREGGELYNKLVENPRVAASAGGFTYRSEHGIRDKASLLRFIRGNPDGVRASDIKDGYDNVLRDAETLVGEGSVFRFYNAEFKVDVFFPAPPGRLTVPPDLVEAYLTTPLPADPQDLIAAVTKLGLRSALRNATSQRKSITLVKQDRPKKKRKMQLRHMTNTHLAHLLTGQQYTSID